jgi:hypothetical protein
MLNSQKTLPEKKQSQDVRQSTRCPVCAGSPRLTHEFLDPRQGKTVHLYRCCGERIFVWSE